MKAQIQQLIAEGKLGKAIELLLQLTERLPDRDLYNEVTHHSAVYARIAKTERLGTESTAEQNVSYAKMNQALLGVVKQLPDENPVVSPTTYLSGNRNRGSKGILAIIALIAAILLSYFLYKNFSGKETEVYKCNERACRDCADCYNSGCFEEAYRCLNALRNPTSEEEKLIQVCIAIKDGDKSLVDGQFVKAKGFYLRAIELDKNVEIHRIAAIQGIASTEKADALLSEGKLEEARGVYQQSVDSKNLSIANYAKAKLEEIEELEKGKPDPKTGALQAILEGKWRQSKSGKSGEIKGELNFEYPANAEAPKILYQNHFANGVIQNGELVNLTYASDNKSLKGVWHNFSTQQRGAFYFEVDRVNNRLKGKYSLEVSQSPSYYWNGNKR